MQKEKTDVGLISRLSSGGVIANYLCNAACGHCMYGCSPNATEGYIDVSTAETLCRRLLKLGCRGLHIGGGEPFLNPEGLTELLRVINGSGIGLDYIETNAGWITGDAGRDQSVLTAVAGKGARAETIMVSADPFHVEFIPFWKTEALIKLLEKNGIPHFIWQQRYLPALRRLDPLLTYGGEELKAFFGYDLREECVRGYGLGFNGRALNIARKMCAKKPAESFLADKPCERLYSTGHFHVDFLGMYVPPGCTGMAIKTEDLGRGLKGESYPVMHRLYSGGVRLLWEYALSRGFAPADCGYASKCDLCYNIRKFLVGGDAEGHGDLSPVLYYAQDF